MVFEFFFLYIHSVFSDICIRTLTVLVSNLQGESQKDEREFSFCDLEIMKQLFSRAFHAG